MFRNLARRRLKVALILISTLAISVGIFTNLFTMVPSTGHPTVDALAWLILGYDLAPRSHSVLSAIVGLFEEGQTGLATIFLVCGVVVPIGKQSALWLLLSPNLTRSKRRRCIKVLKFVAPLSFLEIAALAVMVLAFANFPGGSRIIVREGALIFSIGMLASWALAVLLYRDRMRTATSPLK